MKEYSKYFRTETDKTGSSYVIDYKIENGMVIIRYSNNQVMKYEATPELIATLESRIEQQHKLINKHQEEILANEKRTARQVFYIPMVLLVAFCTIMKIADVNQLLTELGIGLGLLSSIGFEGIMVISDLLFKETSYYRIKLDAMKKEIDERAIVDANVTDVLTSSTKKSIAQNTELKNNGVIETAISARTINIMKLKEMRKLLKAYEASKGLEENLVYVPVQKNLASAKKRTK